MNTSTGTAQSTTPSPEQRRLIELRQKRSLKPASVPISSRGPRGPVRLSAAQAGLWYFCRHEGGNAAYTVPRVFEIEGALDVDRLHSALGRVVERHEALRTVFGEREGQPFQLVRPAEIEPLTVTELRKQQVQEWLRRQASQAIDLAAGPIVRFQLARTGHERYILFLLWHHIVSDQASGLILDEEIGMLYRGQEPPELPVQFADYADWEAASLANAEEARSFWRQYLDGAPPLLDLAFGKIRPAERTYRGEVQVFESDPELADRIRSFSATHRFTLFSIFLAAYGLLLSRYAGRTDLTVGVPVSGRDVPELEKLIGYFVNLLPLRLEVRPEWTFEELVRDCRAQFGECFATALPLDAILDAVRPERSSSYPPLFQFVVNYVREGPDRLQLEGVSTRKIPFHNGASPFDLTVLAVDRSPDLRFLFEYNPAIFDSDTIARMGGHFLNILRRATAGGPVQTGAIAMLSDRETHTLFIERNATEDSRGRTETVLSWFDRNTARNRASWCARSGGFEWTGVELSAYADCVRAALEASSIQPDDVVAVEAARSLETVGIMLGIWKTGAVWLPLDPRWPAERRQFAISDSGAKILIDAAWTANHLPIEAPAKDSFARADSIAYVLYTSGSTGLPKGVAIRHDSLLNCLLSARHCPGFAESDTMLSVTPLSFDISLSQILLPFITGGKLIFPDFETATSPRALRRLQEEGSVTVMQATPSLWRALIDEGWSTQTGLRAWCTGEAMPPELAEALLNRAGEVWNLYGPTETTIWSTVHRVSSGQSPVPIGRPMGNTQCYVLDASLQPVPDGVPGELFIGGLGVSAGYVGQAAHLNKESFPPNPFAGGRMYRTGDIVLWSRDGEGPANLVFLHRNDTQVKVRGHRIELGEVETLLASLPEVRQAVAGLYADALVAWIVPSEGIPWNPRQLLADLRTRLPAYMAPSRLIRVGHIPLNSSGKVDRKQLPPPEPETAPEIVPTETQPQTCKWAADTTEQVLQDLWQELLDVRPIGNDENFFDLGGHSLLALKLYSRIESVFGKRIPDAALIHAPTIRGLAAILRVPDERGFRSLVPLQVLGGRPPFFCMHAGSGSVLNMIELARSLGSDQPVYGLQSAGLGGTRPHHTRIEDMAEWYLREIRSVQPAGPYYIAGYCFGALVALEISHQLTAAGERVAMLAIIGAALPGARPVATPRQRVRSFYRQWSALPGRQRLSWGFSRLRWHLTKTLTNRAPKSHVAGEVQTELLSAEAAAVNAAHRVAEKNYRLLPCSHIITLFRTPELASGDPTAGWGPLAAAGLEIEDLPGTHVSSMKQPLVKTFATTLKQHLKIAQDREKTT